MPARSSSARRPGPATDRGSWGQPELLRTLAGRTIVLGASVKLVNLAVLHALGRLPAVLGVLDTLAGLALAVAAGYVLVRLLAIARRRLLWRVRRKLMLSYVFIGFVPAILIVAFFLLCGLLLFYNFSSYLVQSRLRTLGDHAQLLAEGAALEIERAEWHDVNEVLSRRQRTAARDYQSISVAVVPVDFSCDAASRTASPAQPVPAVVTAGDWTHLDTPSSMPGWIGCSGFAGVLAYVAAPAEPPAGRPTTPPVPQQDAAAAGAGANDPTRLLVRAVAFPDSARSGFAVLVDLPVDGAMRQQLRRDTGVELGAVSAMTEEFKPLAGRPANDRTADVPAADGPLSLKSLLEYRDWRTGRVGTLMLTTQLNVGELYGQISESQGLIGRNFSQGLLLVLLVIGVLFLIIEFVAFVAGLALARSITGSVHELFVGTARVRQGDFTHKIAVTADDQLGELAQSFNSMTGSIENLMLEAAEKKRLEEELRIARNIQMSLLPQGPLSVPGLSVTALCVPAREVGGDYYDVLPLADDRLGVLIADVSGKGTSAAFYMAELKGLILSLSRIHTSPRELLIAANGIIAANLDSRSFITMTYAVLDMHLGTMTYARAGHTPLMYVPGAGTEERGTRILAPDGMVLGLNLDAGEMFEHLLEEQTVALRPGDLYLLFTDGISEAMNEADDCFGEVRLARLLEEHAHLPLDELRERVLRAVEGFVGAAPQHDDMTMILLRVEPVTARPTAEPRLGDHQFA
jgi:serine phosphatase RsbU (regulator of sigma subunit)